MGRQFKFLILMAIIMALAVMALPNAEARDDKVLFSSNEPRTASGTSTALTTGVAVASSATTLYSVTYSNAIAGAVLEIYDNTSATGTPKFDISVGTANETQTLPLGPDGVSMANGIFIKASKTAGFATVVYE